MSKTVSSLGFIKCSFCLLLSFLTQFTIGSFIWTLCSNISINRNEKKLNVSLMIPLIEEKEEQQYQDLPKELLHMPEIEETEIKPLEMSIDEILPLDQFEEPRIMEEPVIPKIEPPAPKKKKKEIRKEAPKIVKPEMKEVFVETSKPIQGNILEPKQVSIPAPVKEKKLIPTASPKPVLTKSQQNENSKYLSKVMKIFEKNKVYPKNARAMHVEGKIIISFRIDKDGKTSDVSAKTKEPKVLANAAEELVRKSELPTPPSHWDTKTKIELPISYKLR